MWNLLSAATTRDLATDRSPANRQRPTGCVIFKAGRRAKRFAGAARRSQLWEISRVRRDEFWALADDITFLNHGSYGACPRAVLERQRQLRDRMEAEPVRFMTRELEPLLDEARAVVAGFVGADPRDLVPVTNATTAVNAVVRSLTFAPGDELLITSHGYNACNNVVRLAAERCGATVVVADVPFPLTSADQVVDAVLGAVTPRTRLAVIDHITSPTALIFPIERLVRQLEDRGVMVLVDGAHAPGMVPLALDGLGASFFTGNLHKWVCGPKGSAFLHVRRDRQALVRPAVVSHGANSRRTDRSRFQLEFDWVGTGDPTPFLSVPRALELLTPWPELMRRNHDDALAARALLATALGVSPPAPADLIGAMAALPLRGDQSTLEAWLFDERRIQVPIIPFGGAWLVRVSLQRHVREGDVRALADALLARNAGVAG
jgi:isopenicillin-N epimerase